MEIPPVVDYEVVVDFDAWTTDLILGRTWHASQEFTELPDGCSRPRLRLNNIEQMERWVLSWGTHAIVVRPKALAERIQKTSQELVSRYRMLDILFGYRRIGAHVSLRRGDRGSQFALNSSPGSPTSMVLPTKPKHQAICEITR